MDKRSLILLPTILLSSCYYAQRASTKVDFNPNADILAISRVAVPYLLTGDGPLARERGMVSSLSVEQGLLSLGYKVVDRGEIEALLNEYKLSLVGLSSSRDAAEIGRILDIQGLVIPTVVSGDQPNVKLIELGTGRIIWNASGPLIFDSLADELEKAGWSRLPDPMRTPASLSLRRLAFARDIEKIGPLRRLGVLPFLVGFGLSGGIQADKIAGDLLGAGFDVIERAHLSRLLEELKLSYSGILLQKNARKIGEILNLEVLVIGVAYNYVSDPTVAVKFVHLETGEVLCIYRGPRSGFSRAARSIHAGFSREASSVQDGRSFGARRAELVSVRIGPVSPRKGRGVQRDGFKPAVVNGESRLLPFAADDQPSQVP